MKRQTQLLNALALNVGSILSASFQVVASIPGQVAGQAPLPSLAPVPERVLLAVVSIQAEGTASQGQKIPKEFKKFFGDNLPDQPTQPFEDLNSGAIINANKGYVLANNHVISQAQKVSVQLNDGHEFDTKLIGSDDQSNTALLQIQNPGKLTRIAIADSDRLHVGNFTAAVGDLLGLGQTATSGIISALGHSGLNLEGLEDFIQTGASINHSNSGGALLNLGGELIGTNTAILVPGGGSVGIEFAILSSIARTLTQQLINFGRIKHGLLSIEGTEMSADITKAFNLDVQRGAFVSEVLPGPGSVKAGAEADDIIISPNDKPLNSFAELRSRVATAGPGTKIKLGLLRNDKPLEVGVTLGTGTSSSTSAEMITPVLEGATLSDGQLKDGGKGVKIDEVVKGGPAAQASLREDDVIIGINRDRVNSIVGIRKVLAAKPAIIALQIIRGNKSLYLLMR